MSFLTGRYGFQIGVWDNGSPLRSEIPTFAHYLQAGGYQTTLCGRMHMIGGDRFHGFARRLYDDMTRWTQFGQLSPRTPQARRGSNSHVTESGPGAGSHQQYDATVTDLTVRFLREKARKTDGRPWVLVSGLMFPHFPLIAPPDLYRAYDTPDLVLAQSRLESMPAQHPAVQQLRRFFRNDQPLPEEVERRALASYYALVTHTDRNLARMIEAVEDTSLRNNTVIIYLSDHGEMAGAHGIWQKQCFYEPSVGVPLILGGPDIPRGQRVEADVSLVDIAPTLLDLAGVEPPEDLPGVSLLEIIRGRSQPDRPVFSEYHAQGSLSAGFMIKSGRYKYNAYVGSSPELFDLSEDPGELDNRVDEDELKDVRERLHGYLLDVVGDPEQIDRLAKENQAMDPTRRADHPRFGWSKTDPTGRMDPSR
jgi:choline-sulfatase